MLINLDKSLVSLNAYPLLAFSLIALLEWFIAGSISGMHTRKESAPYLTS